MSHKKPRVEGSVETEAFMAELSAPLIASILQQQKDPFVSALMDLKAKDLNELEDKVHKMSSWIMDCKLQLKREAGACRKEEQQQQLQSIYQQPIEQQCNNLPVVFTTASALILLDSGFLGSEEIGKLFLLTGKRFLGHLHHLQLKQDFVWKKMFEAKFSPKEGHGLSSLYKSQKFNQILEHNGWEWAFRHFFGGSSNRQNRTEIDELPIRCIQEPFPDSMLNRHNIFFIVLIRIHEEYHAEVVDNEDKIEEFMAGEENRCCITEQPLDVDWSEFSILSIRMDTYECTMFCESTSELEAGVPLNSEGEELMNSFLGVRGRADLTALLEFQDFGINNKVTISLGFRLLPDPYIGTDYYSFGMNMYRCLDYGIDW